MAYGIALRQRVLLLYDEGLQTRAVARQLRVSESWCRRVKQRRDELPRKIGGGHFKLDDAARAQLVQWVDQKPDATLQELRARFKNELNIQISIGALWNALRRLKLTLKKSRRSPANSQGPMSRWLAGGSLPGNSRMSH
jgi:transposase